MLAAMKTETDKIRARLDRLRSDEVAPELREDVRAVADSLEKLLDGAVKGGTVRAKKLSKKRRKEIATAAANKRWKNE